MAEQHTRAQWKIFIAGVAATVLIVLAWTILSRQDTVSTETPRISVPDLPPQTIPDVDPPDIAPPPNSPPVDPLPDP